MGTTRRMLAEAVGALQREGLDVSGYVRLLAAMALGYREIGIRDRIQLSGHYPKRYKPKLGQVRDPETGEMREVVLVDEQTQFRALKVIGEMMGLLSAGGLHVNVGIGDGNTVGDGNAVQDLGGLVVMLKGSGSAALEEAVRALPAPERRRLAEASLLHLQEGTRDAVDQAPRGREPDTLAG